MLTELVQSKYISNFEKSVVNLMEVELEKISIELDLNNNPTNLGCLWHRFDQLNYAIKIMEGKYATDTNKKLGDQDVITLMD